jgi:hypothetical protein
VICLQTLSYEHAPQPTAGSFGYTGHILKAVPAGFTCKLTKIRASPFERRSNNEFLFANTYNIFGGPENSKILLKQKINLDKVNSVLNLWYQKLNLGQR